MSDTLEDRRCGEVVKARLHYIYCVYSDFKYKPVEEVRDFFSIDVGDDANIYNVEKLELCLNKDGVECVRFFDDESPFVPWNMAFTRDGSCLGYGEACYFGISYYDTLLTMDEVDNVKNQIEKRRSELCLM